jgi:hypothetical protein
LTSFARYAAYDEAGSGFGWVLFRRAKEGQATAKANPYGMTNKRTDKGKGKGKGKAENNDKSSALPSVGMARILR